MLRFLEARFGVAEPDIGPYRRAVWGDLTGAFDFATPGSEPLPTLGGRKSEAEAGPLRIRQAALAQIAPPGPAARAVTPQGPLRWRPRCR